MSRMRFFKQNNCTCVLFTPDGVHYYWMDPTKLYPAKMHVILNWIQDDSIEITEEAARHYLFNVII